MTFDCGGKGIVVTLDELRDVYGVRPPKRWFFDAWYNEYMARWKHPCGLTVIVTVELRQGKRYLHVSFSRRDRTPTYRDMTMCKDHFIGVDRKAIMVLPARDEHVSDHPFCLHLFAFLDDDPLPDFRALEPMLGRPSI